MRKKRDVNLDGYAKVRKRLDQVPATTAAAWADTTLWTVQEGLEKRADPAALAQAREGTVALLAAVDSLLDRLA